jgi:hypothetical protein
MIWRNDVVAICKLSEERLPTWKATGPMQEQQRLAGATAAHERPAVANR